MKNNQRSTCWQGRYSKEQMYALIRKWEESELPQKEFIHQHGIARGTFGYWRTKYLKETGSGKDSFIPVKVDHAVNHNTETLEVVYPNGVRLLYPAAMDLALLKPLIIL